MYENNWCVKRLWSPNFLFVASRYENNNIGGGYTVQMLATVPMEAELVPLLPCMQIWGRFSKPGRRRQREEPGKDRFRISDLFATLLTFILAQIFCQSSIASLSLTTKERLWWFFKMMFASCQQKWSIWSRTWGTTAPISCQFHIFTCSFCLRAAVTLELKKRAKQTNMLEPRLHKS